MTPTARTLAFLRRCGFCAAVVERRLPIPGKHVTVDLFGCIDVVAVRRGEVGVLGVQATSRSNVSHRVAKAKQQPALRTWLACGNRFECWGWERVGAKWAVKRVAVTGADLATTTIVAPPRRPGGRGHRQGTLFG